MHVEHMNIDEKYVPNHTEKSIGHVENVSEKPHGESHVEPNVEVFNPTISCSLGDPTSVLDDEPSESFTKQQDRVKPIDNPIMVDSHHVNKLVFDNLFDDIINDKYVPSEDSDDHQNMEAEVLSETSEENNEEVSHKGSLGVKDNGQEEINIETCENDDILITHMMKSLIKSVTKPHDKGPQEKEKEVIKVDKETKTGEEPARKRMVRPFWVMK